MVHEIVPRRFQLPAEEFAGALWRAEKEDPFWQAVAALQGPKFYRPSMSQYTQEALSKLEYWGNKNKIIFGVCADSIPLFAPIGRDGKKDFNPTHVAFSGPHSAVALGGIVMGDIALQSAGLVDRRIMIFSAHYKEWNAMIRLMHPAGNFDVHVLPLPIDGQKEGYAKHTALLLSYLSIDAVNFSGIVPADILKKPTLVAIDALDSLLENNISIREGVLSRTSGKRADNTVIFAASTHEDALTTRVIERDFHLAQEMAHPLIFATQSIHNKGYGPRREYVPFRVYPPVEIQALHPYQPRLFNSGLL